MVVFIFWGIILAVLAVRNIRNYHEPYKFTIIIASLSILIGVVSTRTIRPFLKLNNIQANNFYLAHLYMTIGFFGTFMLIGHNVNSSLSTKTVCENYPLINKIITERKGRYGGNDHLLYLNISNKILEIETNSKYWKAVETGNEINICKYESRIGFDYLVLSDEKY